MKRSLNDALQTHLDAGGELMLVTQNDGGFQLHIPVQVQGTLEECCVVITDKELLHV